MGSIDPRFMTNIAIENHHFLWEIHYFDWAIFQFAMFVYQRVLHLIDIAIAMFFEPNNHPIDLLMDSYHTFCS